jgi:hypothetical protein
VQTRLPGVWEKNPTSLVEKGGTCGLGEGGEPLLIVLCRFSVAVARRLTSGLIGS